MFFFFLLLYLINECPYFYILATTLQLPHSTVPYMDSMTHPYFHIWYYFHKCLQSSSYQHNLSGHTHIAIYLVKAHLCFHTCFQTLCILVLLYNNFIKYINNFARDVNFIFFALPPLHFSLSALYFMNLLSIE